MPVRISNIFVERKTSGVYRTTNPRHLESIENAAASAGYDYVEIDGRIITNKYQFLKWFARALAAPMYFGGDWDYFESELRHQEWITTAGIVIVYRDFDVFQQLAPDSFQILLDIVHSVIQLKSHIFSAESIALIFIFHSESKIRLPPVQMSTPYVVDNWK